MRPCYVCNNESYLGNFIETSGSIVCGYHSTNDGDEYYFTSGMDPLYGIEEDTEICNDCLVSLCKDRRIKIDIAYDNRPMGYCNGCDLFYRYLKQIDTDEQFPYAKVHYFHYIAVDYENEYLFFHDSRDEEGIYCDKCIEDGVNKNILQTTHPMYGKKAGYYGIVSTVDDIHMSTERLRELLQSVLSGWIFDDDQDPSLAIQSLTDRIKHRTYMEEITKRLLLKCFINSVTKPYKKFFDKVVQEHILHYL